MQMVLPASYAVIEEEEMMYLDGGLTKVQKGLIIAGAIACGAALTVALVYGQIALAAKIMGFTFKKMAKKMGAKAVAGVVASSLGVSTTVTFAALNFLL